MIKGLSTVQSGVRASLVIPTLNEAESIGPVLTSFRAAVQAANAGRLKDDPVDWEVLVVDGASTDRTAEIARSHGAVVINEPRPGYGRAYRTGFAQAKGDFIATADGDATYPVDQIPGILADLRSEPFDFITCNRLARLDRKAMTTEHRIGNRILNLVMQTAYHRFLRPVDGTRIEDSQSGMWVFRREILEKLRLTQDGMPFSEELKLEVLLRGYRLKEIPIPYAERATAPKLSSWRDGWKNFMFLFRKRLAVAREVPQPMPVSMTKSADSR
jgi:dolichol-phosphate hexosyltransferase